MNQQEILNSLMISPSEKKGISQSPQKVIKESKEPKHIFRLERFHDLQLRYIYNYSPFINMLTDYLTRVRYGLMKLNRGKKDVPLDYQRFYLYDLLMIIEFIRSWGPSRLGDCICKSDKSKRPCPHCFEGYTAKELKNYVADFENTYDYVPDIYKPVYRFNDPAFRDWRLSRKG
jgi:hypothetical protein